jgi:hypothetical protein
MSTSKYSATTDDTTAMISRPMTVGAYCHGTGDYPDLAEFRELTENAPCLLGCQRDVQDQGQARPFPGVFPLQDEPESMMAEHREHREP